MTTPYDTVHEYVLALSRVLADLMVVRANVGWRPMYADPATYQTLRELDDEDMLTATPEYVMAQLVNIGWAGELFDGLLLLDEELMEKVDEMGYLKGDSA